MPRETKYPTNSYNLWQSFTNSQYCIPNKIPQLNASHSIRPCLGSTLTNHKLQFLQTPLNWQRFQEASPGSLVKANGFGKVKHHQNWAIHRTHMILSKESWFQRSFQDTESHKCAWVHSRFANCLHLKYPTPANSNGHHAPKWPQQSASASEGTWDTWDLLLGLGLGSIRTCQRGVCNLQEEHEPS